jgi:tetratricopeptide (TPR) repeat protein
MVRTSMHGSRRDGARSRVWLVILLVVTALSLLAPRLVRADAAQARAHYEKGRSYFQVGDYRKALEEFQAAHIEQNDVAYIYNVAECHRLLGQPKEALIFYRRFIRMAPANHPSRPDAERRIAELEPATAPAAPPPPAGRQAVAPPPAPLPPPAAPPLPAVAAPPAAQLSSAPADAGPGARPGSGGSRRAIAYVVGGTGLVALAAGGYFGIRARSKWNDSGPHCPQDLCDDTGKSLSDDARTSARLSDVAFGVGLVGVAVAAYLYFTSSSSSAGPSSLVLRW